MQLFNNYDGVNVSYSKCKKKIELISWELISREDTHSIIYDTTTGTTSEGGHYETCHLHAFIMLELFFCCLELCLSGCKSFLELLHKLGGLTELKL